MCLPQPKITPTFQIPAYQQQKHSDYRIQCNTAHVQPMQAAHFVMCRMQQHCGVPNIRRGARTILGCTNQPASSTVCASTAGLTRTERSQSHDIFRCPMDSRCPLLSYTSQNQSSISANHDQCTPCAYPKSIRRYRHYTHNMSMVPALSPRAGLQQLLLWNAPVTAQASICCCGICKQAPSWTGYPAST